MARRQHSLHHNLQPGMNVRFHREHRSKKGRKKNYRSQRVEAQYLHERRERIIKRKMKENMREVIKGLRHNMST